MEKRCISFYSNPVVLMAAKSEGLRSKKGKITVIRYNKVQEVGKSRILLKVTGNIYKFSFSKISSSMKIDRC